jgi:hypothetical protein
MSSDKHDPNSIDAVLARMEERQIQNGEKLDSTIARLESHDARISALERWRTWILGAAAVIGIGLKGLWDWIRG